MLLSVVRKSPRKGQVVVFEGDVDAITLQLRLLPRSQKILIIGPLTDHVQLPADVQMSAAVIVHHVHQALIERRQRARLFLQLSTASHPRLVFMNGGRAGARTLCISLTAERVTEGSVEDARAMVERAIRSGDDWLLKHDGIGDDGNEIEQTKEDLDFEQGQAEEYKRRDSGKYDLNDRSAMAMSRADSLEHETASLDPPATDALDDMPLLNLIHSQSFHEGRGKSPTPHPIFTHNHADTYGQLQHDDGSTRSASLAEKRSTFGLRRNSIDTMPTDMSSTLADDDFDECDVHSSSLESFASSPRPPSFNLLEFGKACIVDVQASMRRSPTRNTPDAKVKVHHNRNPQLLSRKTSLKRSNSTSVLAFTGLATGDEVMPSTTLRSVDDRSNECSPFNGTPATMNRQSSTPTLHANNSPQRGPSPHTYVDRGTDPGEFVETCGGSVRSRVDELNRMFSTGSVRRDSQSRSSSLGKEIDFDQLSSVEEDLVVHLNSGKQNTILESVIESYRKHDHSKVQAPGSCLPVDQSMSDSLLAGHLKPLCNEEELAGEGYSSPPHKSPVADPDGLWPTKISSKSQLTSPPSTPESPSQSISSFPPITNTYQSATTNSIDVQDTLRAILKDNFDSKMNHYKEDDAYDISNWQPVFCTNRASTSARRTVDQIIAIGSEGVVNQEVFHDVAGQIAQLGTTQGGTSRSATLDIG